MTQLAFEWPEPLESLDMNGADRERVREMELRTYACGIKRELHAPHAYELDGRTITCPGLTTRGCSAQRGHTHHRWATPDAFYWCDGRPEKASPPGDAIGHQKASPHLVTLSLPESVTPQ